MQEFQWNNATDTTTVDAQYSDTRSWRLQPDQKICSRTTSKAFAEDVRVLLGYPRVPVSLCAMVAYRVPTLKYMFWPPKGTNRTEEIAANLSPMSTSQCVLQPLLMEDSRGETLFLHPPPTAHELTEYHADHLIAQDSVRFRQRGAYTWYILLLECC